MFRVWYENGYEDGSELSDWETMPDTGVVAIYQTHGFKGNIRLGTISSGSDWYWMTQEGLIEHSGTSSEEPNVWLEAVLPENAVAKKGKWVSDERMLEVNQALIEMSQN